MNGLQRNDAAQGTGSWYPNNLRCQPDFIWRSSLDYKNKQGSISAALSNWVGMTRFEPAGQKSHVFIHKYYISSVYELYNSINSWAFL
jgi:hypothetical protein